MISIELPGGFDHCRCKVIKETEKAWQLKSSS